MNTSHLESAHAANATAGKNGSDHRAHGAEAGAWKRDLPTLAESFEKNGYAVLKGVFSLDEILDFRARVAAVHARCNGARNGDLMTYPELREVALDDRVLTIMRTILGKDVVYFGDSSFWANNRFDRHLHNDARQDEGDPTTTPYPIIRMGIYLQDHLFHSNGLKLRPGSHKTVVWNSRSVLRLFGIGGRVGLRAFKYTPFLNAPTEPGDLVVWNLRMQHAAHALRFRMFDKIALPPVFEQFVPERLIRPSPKDRYAIFASWGAPSPELDRYIRALGNDPGVKPFWSECRFYTPEITEAIAKKGLIVRTDAPKLAQMI